MVDKSFHTVALGFRDRIGGAAAGLDGRLRWIDEFRLGSIGFDRIRLDYPLVN